MFDWIKKVLAYPGVRRGAIERAIVADDWLLNCAQNGAGYCGSFDRWWSIANFDKGVRERFLEERPKDRAPSKEEIKRVLVRIMEGGRHQVDIVDNRLVRR